MAGGWRVFFFFLINTIFPASKRRFSKFRIPENKHKSIHVEMHSDVFTDFGSFYGQSPLKAPSPIVCCISWFSQVVQHNRYQEEMPRAVYRPSDPTVETKRPSADVGLDPVRKASFCRNNGRTRGGSSLFFSPRNNQNDRRRFTDVLEDNFTITSYTIRNCARATRARQNRT